MEQTIEYFGESSTRSGGGAMAARRSLREYKATPAYRTVLQKTVRDAAAIEKAAKSDIEKRRARLDLFEARLELERLRGGEQLDEFSGLYQLPDPMKGMMR